MESVEKVERVENEREMPCKEQEHTHAMVIYNDIHVYNPLHKYRSLTESAVCNVCGASIQ